MKDSSSTTLPDASTMSLEEWLTMLFDPPDGALFVNCSFPTDRHREEYFAAINQRTEEEVYKLLKRFLIPSGTLGIDKLRLAGLKAVQKADPEMFQRMIRLQYYQRLILNASGYDKVQPWEGITWVLDLLPHFPKQALEGLNAYIFAHVQQLPDGRLEGLYDATELIRAKFIGLPGTQSEAIGFLLNLSPRDFECLAACRRGSHGNALTDTRRPFWVQTASCIACSSPNFKQ